MVQSKAAQPPEPSEMRATVPQVSPNRQALLPQPVAQSN